MLNARASGKLTEGRHALPPQIAKILGSAGSETAQVRRWKLGILEPSVSLIACSNVGNAWAEEEFEEIEVGDSSGKWYFRAKDDEPFFFLAVRHGLLLDRIRQCKEFCQEVDGHFPYTVWRVTSYRRTDLSEGRWTGVPILL